MKFWQAIKSYGRPLVATLAEIPLFKNGNLLMQSGIPKVRKREFWREIA